MSALCLQYYIGVPWCVHVLMSNLVGWIEASLLMFDDVLLLFQLSDLLSVSWLSVKEIGGFPEI